MERVIGIGGYFMRAADPAALSAWYRDCLGLDADENGLWRQEAGLTVFATFESGTESGLLSPGVSVPVLGGGHDHGCHDRLPDRLCGCGWRRPGGRSRPEGVAAVDGRRPESR